MLDKVQKMEMMVEVGRRLGKGPPDKTSRFIHHSIVTIFRIHVSLNNIPQSSRARHSAIELDSVIDWHTAVYIWQGTVNPKARNVQDNGKPPQ